MADGPLDMRMDRSQGETAADIVNYESEKELADLIYRLGEERRSRKIARAIVRARPITTTGQLAKLIEQVVPRTGKLHPATQTFMALRIAVNQERTKLDALLGIDSEAGEAGRARGDAHVHVARGPQREAEFSGDGARRASTDSHPSRRAA